jgi:uncharacterized protein (DUF885 family)
MSFRRFAVASLLIVSLASSLFAQSAPPAEPEWVKRSNAYAVPLLQVMARFNPEQAAFFGVEGFDSTVTTLPLDVSEQLIRALTDVRKTLEGELATEKDPAVKQDLQIMIASVDDTIEGTRLSDKYQLPYFNVGQTLFLGIHSLLDDRIPANRRKAALVRLRSYTGMLKGTTPLTAQAMALTRSRLSNGALVGPFKDNLEKDLGNSARYVAGIEQLFKKYGVKDYEQPLALAKQQLAEYDEFLKKEVAPRATTDFRLPEELYRYQLKSRGNDMAVEELVSRAKTQFREIQNEMQTLASLVAKEKGITATDYRAVIRALKKQQFSGPEIMTHYQGRIKQIEQIIRDQHIVTLPQRQLLFRLATEAETADTPAPHVDPPRLIGNTGEQAAFVLPLHIPAEPGKDDSSFDDFTFDAASWTLTAHEGRPGHELQFASILEKGVSQARVLFAFNSVNVEGWALYAEAELKPYEPLDGQLIALQHRLMRAARAFLDPSLQLGRMTREEAFHVLEDDVVLSHAMAQQEVERYTFWAPGQAPSYFVGYSRLMELRTDAERMLGKNFDRQSYHDFILAQGLVPPTLLREAVMNGYVAPRMSKPQS